MLVGDPMRIVSRHCAKPLGRSEIVNVNVLLQQLLPVATTAPISSSRLQRQQQQRNNRRLVQLLPYQRLPRPLQRQATA